MTGREERRSSLRWVMLAFEVEIPDDMPDETVARWCLNTWRLAPETHGIHWDPLVVGVGLKAFWPDDLGF